MSNSPTPTKPTQTIADVLKLPSECECPRCTVPLLCGDWNGVKVHACEACGGVFLSLEGLPQLKRELVGKRGAALSKLAVATATATPSQRQSVACPVCAKWMDRDLNGGESIDRCEEHGIWFDARELERVVRAQRKVPADETSATAVAVTEGVIEGVVTAGAIEVADLALGRFLAYLISSDDEY